jgi:hypothetical protein
MPFLFEILLAIGVTVLIALALVLRARSRSRGLEAANDSTPAVDAWVQDALEHELAAGALGMRASSPEERRKLARTLRGDFDPDVVSQVEAAVRAVELEFVRYAHETDAEVVLRVHYEDGRTGTTTRRLAWTDVPEAVRTDFARRSATRVFRAWPLPWSRVHAL